MNIDEKTTKSEIIQMYRDKVKKLEAENKELREANEWVSVESTRRPEEGQKVLAVYAGVYEPIVVEYWTDTSNSHFGHQPATHWKPLPAPPEEQD